MSKKSNQSLSLGRIILGFGAGILFLGLFALSILNFHYDHYVSQPLMVSGESKQIVIPKGAAWGETVEVLRAAGLIEHPRYFEYWARSVGLDREIKAGHYELNGPIDHKKLASILKTGGKFDEVSFTIPEGFSIFQIADHMDKNSLVSRRDFLDAAQDPEAVANAGILGESFEGYLFPDTYRVRKGSTAAQLRDKMHDRFLEVYAEVASAESQGLNAIKTTYGLDRHGIVTMASIVEEESTVLGERATVARVFYNRLDKPMKLQTDPTCVYGESTYRKRPSPKYCKDPLNRYSTYMIDGLPPGPISNPGRLSLVATMRPDTSPEASKYLFFVAKRDGSKRHYFSATYKEHKKAVNKYLRGR